MHQRKFIGLGLSVTGNVRDHNEDSYIVDEKNQIFIVADGVGGNLAGEIASNFVTEQLYKSLLSYKEDAISKDELKLLLIRINSDLIALSKSRSEYKGMSTTLVLLLKQSENAFICNIGDSRAYRCRNGKLTQISKDHSLVQQMVDLQKIKPQDAADHPLKHYITMAMGTEPLNPDFFELELLENDLILLCSDGLTDMVSDDEIEDILVNHDSLEERITVLKEKALENGGHDNITIVLAKI